MSLRVAMGEVPTTLYFHSPVLVDKIEFLEEKTQKNKIYKYQLFLLYLKKLCN
jgi:hypothetical protein